MATGATFTNKFNNSSTGLFKDNATGDIGADDARTLVTDIDGSYLNFDDDVLDQDDMSSNSATQVPTQQSAKAYVDNLIPIVSTTGTNTYAATPSPAITAYTAGKKFQVKFTEASTGVSTLNLNALGAKKIFINPTTQATTGDIVDEQIYLLIYDAALDAAAGGFLMIGGSGGSQTAAETPFTPAGNIVATDVQAAIEELDATVTELGDLAIDSITGAISLTSADLGTLWELSGTTTDYTVDLPTAVGNGEKTIIFKGLAALTKNVTISGISGQTIDGNSTLVMGGGGSLTLLSDGANWTIINQVGSWINYTPVWAGFSADPPIARAVYFLVGKICTVVVTCSGNGTSNATNLTVTLPFAAKVSNTQYGFGFNNGSVLSSFARLDLTTASSTMSAFTTPAGAAWTASGGKRLNFVITYEIQ